MTTVQERLNWWRRKSYYLGDDVDVSIVNRKIVDKNGNIVNESTTAIVDLTIYTRSGKNNAIERPERWIVPDATENDYLTKPAYYRKYAISGVIREVFIRGRRRRRWRW